MLCDNLEEWDEEEDGGDGGFRKEWLYVHLWLIYIDVWQKPTQCCKAIILQNKKKLNTFFKVLTHIVQLPLERLYQIWLCLLVWFYSWRSPAFLSFFSELRWQGNGPESYNPSVTMDGFSHALFISPSKEEDQTSSGMFSNQTSNDAVSQKLCFQGSSASSASHIFEYQGFLSTINMYFVYYEHQYLYKTK